VLVVLRGLCIEAAGEDDAGDLVLEEHVDVGGLGDPGGRARAEDGREAALREGVRDDLREGGEDRVLQLRQDEADKAARSPRSWVGRS